MKKFFIALGLVASFGAANAQSDFASVDLTVNLNPIASIELAGSATLDINTIEEWTGASTVQSNAIFGTTTTTGSSSYLDVMSLGFGYFELDQAITMDLFTGFTSYSISTMDLNFGLFGMGLPIENNVQPIEVSFRTNGASLLGVPAGSYFNLYDFHVYSY